MVRVSVIVILFLMTLSCKTKKCESTEPTISFSDFVTYADTGNGFNTAKLKIFFKDCDGDVGLDEKDTLPPFNIEGAGYYNLKLEYYELRKGSWTFVDSLEPPFYYRIPNLTPKGKTKDLEGEIEVALEPTYYLPFSQYDTLMYRIQLFDRALQGSNIVETPMIIRP